MGYMPSRNGLLLALTTLAAGIYFARCQTDLEFAKDHAIDASTQLCPGFGRLRNFEFCQQNQACFSSTGNVNNRNMLVIRTPQGIAEVHRRSDIENFGENANALRTEEEVAKYLDLYRHFCGADPAFKEDLPFFRRRREEQAYRQRAEAERQRAEETKAKERAEYEAKLARARAVSPASLARGSIYCQSKELVKAFAITRSQGGNGADGLILIGACHEAGASIQIRIVSGPDEDGRIEFELGESFHWARLSPSDRP